MCSIAAFSLRRRCWVFVAVVQLASALVGAAEAQNERTARLGFSYDRQAHEAAVAAEQNKESLDLEPPADGVIRLRRYRVIEQRLKLEEHRLLTPKGRVEIAKKRYLAPMYQKTLGPLAAVASFLNNPLGGWNPNAPEALALYEDDENLRRRNELKDLSEIADLARDAKRAKAGRDRAGSSVQK